MDRDKMEERMQLLKEAYGFTDEQLLEEFERIKAMIGHEEQDSGDYEALRRRIEELEKKSL